MDVGLLKIYVTISSDASPVANAHIKVSDAYNRFLFETRTDTSGNKEIEISSPSPFFNVEISASGFISDYIQGVQFDNNKSAFVHVLLNPMDSTIGVAKFVADFANFASVWPPYPGIVLRRGMQGPSIAQVQERLNELGTNPRLATDGIFGALTEAAVMAFQRTNGLTPDGIVGPITWNALFSRIPVPPPVWPPYPGVVLRRGMQGPSIAQVQERLNELGANPRLATDGIFGALTEAAVMAFQRANGLTADGVVGPITWNSLFSNRPIPPTPPIPPPPPPSSRTIVIDPGHGGHDPGAVSGTRRESDDVLRLSLAVQRILQSQGQRVIMTRSTDVFVTLPERSAISNRNNANIFVSIHRNSSTNPAANGVENYVFTTAPANTIQNAFDVLDEVVDAGVQNNRGVIRGNFSVLRNTQAPAMLLEMGFISNVRDNQLFDQNLNRYANAIANGIMNALRSGQQPRPYTFYTVVSGDTLGAIAQRFGTTPNAIIQLNKLTSNSLITGQILKIPR